MKLTGTTCICILLTADLYGISSADVHVKISITTNGSSTSGTDFPLVVVAAGKNFSDFENGRLLADNTLTWEPGDLGMQYALIRLNNSEAKVGLAKPAV